MTIPGFDSQLLEALGYRVRPLKTADVSRLLALLERSAEESSLDPPSHDAVVRILERLGNCLATDSLAVLSETGEPIAAALVFLPPSSGDEISATLLGVVHPNSYKRGLGTAMLDWMEQRVRTAQQTNKKLQSMRMSCDPQNLARVCLFEQHAFKAVRYSFKMQAALIASIEEPTISSGLSLIPWQSEWSESARTAFNRAFAEHWGLPTISKEMWMSRFVGVPQFRPDLSSLIVRKREVMGVCINWAPPGAEYGWIEAIGVVPEWRGQGVADAMMTRALNTFRECGFSQVCLDVDTQNPTGALQLYEKYGFTPVKREAIFVKVLG